MPKLIRAVAGAEPVTKQGTQSGPPVTLTAGTEFIIIIGKLKRPSQSFEELWCEIKIGEQLYRVPLRLLESSSAL